MKIIYVALLLTFCSCSAMRVNQVISNTPRDTSYLYEHLQLDKAMLESDEVDKTFMYDPYYFNFKDSMSIDTYWSLYGFDLTSGGRKICFEYKVVYKDFMVLFREYDENGKIISLTITSMYGSDVESYIYNELGEIIQRNPYGYYPICWQLAYKLGKIYDHKFIRFKSKRRIGVNSVHLTSLNSYPYESAWGYIRGYIRGRSRRKNVILISPITGEKLGKKAIYVNAYTLSSWLPQRCISKYLMKSNK